MGIFIMVCAAVCLVGMIGDRVQENRNNFAYGFVICMVAVIVKYIMKG